MATFIDTVTAATVERDVNDWWWTLRVVTTQGYDTGTDMVYTSFAGAEGTTLYVGKDGEWVRCYAHQPSHEQGFGGMTITLHMDDNTTRSIKGPWTGRPAVYMAVGAEPYMEAAVCKDERFGGGMILGVTRTGVEEILAKFNLPFKTDIGPMYEGSEEEALIIIPR